ncbi:MAG: PVC-type heme-binding CxxCH protein, partial [Verrucomicrobiota bacterium]
VWVCSAPNLLFIPDRDGDDIPDGEPEVVLDGWTTQAKHNFFNGLTWGVDGWLYGRHGITRPSLVGKPGASDSERIAFDCSIWRYHPVRKTFEIVCRGTTNPWGMDWDANGELFFTNNVNGHLWHAVPGALFPRMGNRPDANVKFDYERMPITADHLHHAGTTADWTKTRDGLGVHGDLGGGHSHCGGMIYLGNNWPDEYRGRIFMCNTHGRRINQNLLERRGSAYVGKRAPDLFFANQPWFRGVSLLYGPDGGVFVSDWTDLGECHDNDGVHRSSGRIFKMTYGKPALSRESLAMLQGADEMLVQLHLHENEWFTRKARRLLQERKFLRYRKIDRAIQELHQMAISTRSTQIRIRALTTLQALDAVSESMIRTLFQDNDEHLRKWGIRLAVDHGAPSPNLRSLLVSAAKSEESSLVRLYLASALQKIPFADRWELAQALASRSDDADDRYLPLMVWFGVKDALAVAPLEHLAWLDSCNFPKLHHFTAQLACETQPSKPVLAALLDRMQSDEGDALELAEGMVAGLGGQRELPKLEAWPAVRDYLTKSESPELAIELGLLLAPTETNQELVQRVKSGDAKALELLFTARAPKVGDLLADSLESPKLRKTALRGLAQVPNASAPSKIIKAWPILDATEKTAAITTLVATKRSAAQLLDAMETGRVPRSALTAFQARQIQAMKDSALTKRVTRVWGELKASDATKRAEIKRYQNQLTSDILAKADLPHGKTLYSQRCAACHTLFGEGGNIGPDLNGANRSDLYYLLENIIDPSATLPRDFHVTLVTKNDGQLLTGNLAKTTDYTLTLTTPAGDVVINREDIKQQSTSPVSLMPEGLFNGLEINDVRDLIGYLMK